MAIGTSHLRHAALLSAGTLVLSAAFPAAAQVRAHGSVPPLVTHSTKLGPVNPNTDVRVTVWLAMKKQAEFDKATAAIYTPGSPSYHHWMQPEDLKEYGPTAAERKVVEDQLAHNGLSVVKEHDDAFSIEVRGSAANIERAFETQLTNFSAPGGKTFRANETPAHLSGRAGELVASVSGLNDIAMRPLHVLPINPRTKEVVGRVPVAKAVSASGKSFLSDHFTNQCFKSPETFTLGTQGKLPIGVYFGNVYDQGTNSAGVSKSCGYTAAQVQANYSLQRAYSKGFTGSGQTIIIVDAYGSPTILSDANTFSTLNGLPALNSSNFQIIYPAGKPLYPPLGVGGWDVETSLDVEWAHAIAPEAKIVLLVAASQDDQDFQYAVQYATMHKLGSVISNSYGLPEIEHGPLTLNAYNQVIKMAAASGISVNYSSGDGGDLGLGSPVGAVLSPSDSPYATAVGGTSLGIPNAAAGGRGFEVGWGNNATYLAFSASSALDPPFNLGNVGGAGGGQSVFFSKPSWQSKLPGSFRLTPDIAAIADPYTGGIIVYTDPNLGQGAFAVGGTSLACPVFSAIWALANQSAGHLLGQAAPIIANLGGGIHDIRPVTSATNVTGTIVNSSGATFYSSDALLAPLQGTTKYYSAVWPIQGSFIDLSFGTDSSLRTTAGWDNVTGFGSPNGSDFIDLASKK